MKGGLKNEGASGWIWPVLLGAAWLAIVSFSELVWHPTHLQIFRLLREGAPLGRHLFFTFLAQTVGLAFGILLALVFLLLTIRTCFRIRVDSTAFAVSIKKWLSVAILLFCLFIVLLTGIIILRSFQLGDYYLSMDFRLLDYFQEIALPSILCCTGFSLSQENASWKHYGVQSFLYTLVALALGFGSIKIFYLFGATLSFSLACAELALWIAKGTEDEVSVSRWLHRLYEKCQSW